jgi:hypothetical protein
VAKERDEAEQKLFNILKYVRTFIRLKHAINADNELNKVVPVIESRFWAAFSAGQVFSIDEDNLKELLDGVQSSTA